MNFNRSTQFIVAAVCALLPTALFSQVLYWDTNDATPGSTNTRQTWSNTHTWWSTSAAGDIATQAWTPGATAVFSAGTNATGYTLVDIGPNVFAPSIYVEEGEIEFFGGTVVGGYFRDLSTLDVASGASAVLNIALNETPGSPVNFTKTGAGTLNLITGINNTTGTTTVSGGTVTVNSVANLSSGDLTVQNGSTLSTSGVLEFNSRTVRVTGPGSTLASTGFMEFGDFGANLLNVENGGLVRSDSTISFGLNGGVVGEGTVRGAGSKLTTPTGLFLGYNGIGSLDIFDGARVEAGTVHLASNGGSAGGLGIYSGGTLAVGGTDGIRRGSGQFLFRLGGGTLEVAGSNLTTSVPATLSNTSTINTNGLNATLSGLLSGSGALAKSGAGVLTLPNANTYTGGTIVNAGTLAIGNNTSLGAPGSNLTLNGGILDLGTFSPTFGTVTFKNGSFTNGTVNNAAAFEVRTGSLANPLGGAAALTKTGAGTFTLFGANTYTGGTIVNDGILNLGHATNTLADTGAVTVSGGTLNLGPNSDTVGAVTLSSGSITGPGTLVGSSYNLTGTGTISAPLAGSATLTKSGPGTATLQGNNSYTGGTHLLGGTLQISSDAHLGAAPGSSTPGNITLNGGTLASTATFTLSPYRGIALGSSGGSIAPAADTTLTYAGDIAGSGTFTKSGDGILLLSGPKNYAGNTTVSAGTLLFTSPESLYNGVAADWSKLTVASGAKAAFDVTSQNFGPSEYSALLNNATFTSGTPSVELYFPANHTLTEDFDLDLSNTTTPTATLTLSGSTPLKLGGKSLDLGAATNQSFIVNRALGGGIHGAHGAPGTDLPGGLHDTTLGSYGSTGGAGEAGSNAGNLTHSGGTISFAQPLVLTGGHGGNGGKGGHGGMWGNGGNGGNGGRGGDGGILTLSDGTASFDQSLNLSGGNGGNGGAGGYKDYYYANYGSPGTGGTGGNGGTLNVTGGTATFGPGAALFLYGGSGAGSGAAGTLALSDGTLQLPTAGWLESTSTFVGNFAFTGGILRTTDSGDSLALDGTSKLGQALANGNVTADRTLDLAGNLDYSGGIGGSGAFTKAGAGTLTLSDATTFAGVTNVSGGTLTLGNSNALQSSAVNLNGGSLTYSGVDTATLGGLSGSGNLSLPATSLSVGNNGEDTTFAGIVSGDGDLIKIGSGTLTLSGTNTYTGNTTISSGGSLQLGDGGNSGSVAGNIANSGTLIFNRSDDYQYDGVVSGSGGLTHDGYILRLANPQTYTGPTFVKSGGYLVLSTSSDQGLSASSTVDLESGSFLDIANRPQTIAGLSGAGTIYSFDSNGGHLILDTAADQSHTFSGILGHTAPHFALTKTGPGTQTLSGANNYTGSTTVSGGTLSIAADSALGAAPGSATPGHFTLDGGTLATTDSFTLSPNRGIALGAGNGTFDTSAATSLTVGGNIAGSGGLIKAGAGTLALNGLATHEGGTVITDGTVRTDRADAFSPTSGISVSSPALFDLNDNDQAIGSLAGEGTVNLGSAHLTTGADNTSTTFSGTIAETGNLTKTGTGVFTLSGTNTYSGTTAVANGTLRLGSTTALDGTSAVTVNSGAALDLNDNSVTLAALDGAGSVALGSATLITGDQFDHAISGTISGSGALTKVGGGTLSLSGSNSYTGATVVEAGTLAIANHTNLGAGDISISGGASLTASGDLQFGGDRKFTVDGAGSSFASNGFLWFDRSADSSNVVEVTNGGAISTGTSFSLADANPGSTGTLLVSGAGSTVSSGGDFYVGYWGHGIATVENGGVITAGGPLWVATYAGSSGTINLNSGGTLRVGGTTNIGSGTALLNANGGTLEVTGSNLTTAVPMVLGAATDSAIQTNSLNATLSGVVSGGGALTKTGAGMLTLSGANTYTGGTTVSAGTLVGNTTSLQGNITNNAALVFDQASAGTYTGAIDGTGSLTKTGSGALTLSGANSYSGGTTVSSGTLTGTAASIQGDVTNNAAVVFDQTSTGTYAGSMSGSGTLTKSGAGSLILSGTNNYSGNTTISNGSLVFSSSDSFYNGDTTQWNKLTVANGAGLAANVTSLGFGASEISALLNKTTFASGARALELYFPDNYSLTQDVDLDLSSTPQAAFTLSGGTPLQLNGNTLTLGTGSNHTLTVDRLLAGGSDGPDGDDWIDGANYIFPGDGGEGGSLLLAQGNPTFLQPVNLSGGVGGAGGNGGAIQSAGQGGNGGNGGTLSLEQGSVSFNQAVTLAGGDGGNAGDALPNHHPDDGGNGGNGGLLSITGGTLEFTASASLNLAGGHAGSAGGTSLGGSVGNAGNDGAHGTLALAGGTLQLPSVGWLENAATFTGNFTFAGGTLKSTDAGASLSLNGTSQLGQALADNAVTAARTLDLAGNLDYSGVIAGSGSLTKAGAGALTLTGENSYIGETTIAGGTLQIGDGGSSGSLASSSITNNANLTFNRSNASSYTGSIAGSGSLTKSGAGTLTLTGENAYTGETTIAEGTLQIGDGGSSGSLASNSITNNGHLTFNRSNASSYTGSIAGSGSLSKAGAGALTLTGENTYTGETTIAEGILQIGDGGSSGSLASSSITNSGNLTFNRSNASSYAGSITGSGSLTKAGAGTLTLTGENAYTGETTISEGILQIGDGGSSGTIVGNIINNGTIAFNRSDDYTFGGVISGSGGLIQRAGVLRLASLQTYTGPTLIEAGFLVLTPTADQGLAPSASVHIASGGTLDISNRSLTIANLSGAGNIYSHGGDAGHLTVETVSGQTQTFSGNLGSTYRDFSFTKSGAGKLVLSGTNTYTGTTTVNEGTLEITHGLLSEDAGLLVAPSGTLSASETIAPDLRNNGNVVALGETPLTFTGEVSGTGQFAGDFVFAGTTRPGASPGLMAIDGDLSFAPDHILEMEIAGLSRGDEYDAFDVTGSLNLDGTLNVVFLGEFEPQLGDSFRFFDVTEDIEGSFDEVNLPSMTDPILSWDTSSLYSTGTVGVIPEPRTYALLFGLTTLGFVFWRKRKA